MAGVPNYTIRIVRQGQITCLSGQGPAVFSSNVQTKIVGWSFSIIFLSKLIIVLNLAWIPVTIKYLPNGYNNNPFKCRPGKNNR
ncbi:unnamed protein product [Ceutorhynchus assimilis]|uniref:Uncharacterized protein n=1 Tax=Ceutorhynchus assimilis TaxID=467358 RepID=A0A9N9M8N5_9CUCU|nr:unnamed protein product [Ceutorhynchus assimilis]